MIKRLALFALIVVTLVVASWSLAQEPTPQETPASVDAEKIKALKEKLATKVAELRESQTRGFSGEIASLSKTSFTLVTNTAEVRVRISDDTQIFTVDDKKGEKSESSADDLKNTLTASVLGFYDTDEEMHNAKVILLQSLPQFIEGEVTAIDDETNTLTIKTTKGSQVIDYERTTKAQEYSVSEESLKKSGLSRIAIGDLLHVWGSPDEDDAEKLNALSLFRLPKEMFGSDVAGETTASPSASPKTTPRSSPKSS